MMLRRDIAAALRSGRKPLARELSAAARSYQPAVAA
jgi:hypothetical protein